MKRTTPETDTIPGFWIGSNYGIEGERWDYAFDLLDDGVYVRRKRRENEEWMTESGSWGYDGALRLVPTGEPIAPTAYGFYLIPRFEDSRSILVLRSIILATPNLPMILYRDLLRTLEAKGGGQGADDKADAVGIWKHENTFNQ